MEPKNQTTPVQPPTTQPPVEPVKEIIGADLNKSKSTSKLGLILAGVGLVVVISALCYFFVVRQGTKLTKSVTPTATPTPTVVSKLPIGESDASTVALEEQGVSDEIVDIETDLNSTDLTEIDKELTDIESELSPP